MKSKKFLKPALIATFLIMASVSAILLEREAQLEAVRDSVLALTIYSLVFLIYGLRIAFIVFGLIALYRILWKSVNDKELKRGEV